MSCYFEQRENHPMIKVAFLAVHAQDSISDPREPNALYFWTFSSPHSRKQLFEKEKESEISKIKLEILKSETLNVIKSQIFVNL